MRLPLIVVSHWMLSVAVAFAAPSTLQLGRQRPVLDWKAPLDPVAARAWAGLQVVRMGGPLRPGTLTLRETQLLQVVAPVGMSLQLDPVFARGLMGTLRGGMYVDTQGGRVVKGSWIGLGLGYRWRSLALGVDLWRLLDGSGTKFAAPFAGFGF